MLVFFTEIDPKLTFKVQEGNSACLFAGGRGKYILKVYRVVSFSRQCGSLLSNSWVFIPVFLECWKRCFNSALLRRQLSTEYEEFVCLFEHEEFACLCFSWLF